MSLTVDHSTLISVSIEVENGTRYLSVTLEEAVPHDNPFTYADPVRIRFTDEGLQGFASRVEATMLLNAIVAQYQDEDEL